MILLESSNSCSAGEIKSIIEDQQRAVENTLRELNSLGEGRFSALQRIERIKEDCSSPGWDGEDAQAVSLASYNNAKRFLSTVPLGIVAPDPGVDVKGQMTLEWRRFDGRLLSLTFDDQEYVHYIVFLGSEKFYAKSPISLGYSEKLKDLLEDVIKE